MRKYELSLAADRGLDDIYTYTFREFGVLQADAYFESLQECLIALGDNPLLGIDAGSGPSEMTLKVVPMDSRRTTTLPH